MTDFFSSLLLAFPDAYGGRNAGGIESVGSSPSRVTPSPLARSVLDPRDIIAYPNVQVTSDYSHHVLGIGRGTSKSPGSDYDVVGINTERLNVFDRPIVTSTSSGVVTMVKQYPWGT